MCLLLLASTYTTQQNIHCHSCKNLTLHYNSEQYLVLGQRSWDRWFS